MPFHASLQYKQEEQQKYLTATSQIFNSYQYLTATSLPTILTP